MIEPEEEKKAQPASEGKAPEQGEPAGHKKGQPKKQGGNQAQSKNLKSKTSCLKCKSAKPKFVFRTDYYCPPCFIAQFESKVVNALTKIQKLGKSDLTKKELTLLCLSGGQNSLAMVRAITSTMEDNHRFHRSYTSVVLHIDERCLYPDNPAAEQELTTLR